MSTIYILVANASRAKLYQLTDKKKVLTGKEKMKLIKEFSHPESRQKNIEIASDNLGNYKCKNAGTGSFVEATNPKQYEAESFAIELAHMLDAERGKNAYDELIIVASPQFYGRLKQHLNTHVNQLTSNHITKDYTQYQDHQLLSSLESYLTNAPPEAA